VHVKSNEMFRRYMAELHRLEEEAGVPKTLPGKRIEFDSLDDWLARARESGTITINGTHNHPRVTYVATDLNGLVMGQFDTHYHKTEITRVVSASGWMDSHA